MATEDRQTLWRDGVDAPAFEALKQDREVDVAIVGAGITGLTLALLLRDSGLSVAVIERDRIASGVSGRTTGHLTTMPDARVHELIDSFGEDSARQVVTAMAEAVDAVERTVAELAIDCDFRRTDGYLFAAQPEDRDEVERELEACRRLGMPVGFAESHAVALPFAVPAALRVEGQARFHPVKYLAALARAASEAGVAIDEGTRAHHLHAKDTQEIETQHGQRLSAREVVLATHTPAGIDVLQSAAAPYRSYALAFRPRGPVPEGLYWDTAEPYHYVRPQGELVVVGGADHKTGGGDPGESQAALERWVKGRFEVEEITHRWSSQVYEPIDGLPFIGRRATNRHVWVATGFSGDGLVWGTVAAHILAARLQDRDHPHAELLDTKRFEVRAGGGRFVKENLDVAKHFVGDRLGAFGEGDVEDVDVGEGRVLRKGRKVLAVHRDRAGQLHVRDAVCPHLKCVVKWNRVEGSWDCPCHGARYDADGKVLEGPSMHDLHQVEDAE